MTRNTTEFRIQDSVPSTGDVDVAVDTQISLNLTNPVDTDTLDQSFELSSLSSGSTAFSVDTNADNTQIVITPDSDLNYGETYVLLVISDSKNSEGLKDVFGSYLGFGTTSVRFSTTSSKFSRIELTDPSDKTALLEPITLQWNEVDVNLENSTPVADDYDVQVSDGSDFSNILWSTNTTDTEATIGADLPDDTTIFWRVRAHYSDNNIDITSDWSPTHQFFHGEHISTTEEALPLNVETIGTGTRKDKIDATIEHGDVFTDRYRAVITFGDNVVIDDTTVDYSTIFLTSKEIHGYDNRPVWWPLDFTVQNDNEIVVDFLDMSNYDGTDVVINYPLDPSGRADTYEINWSDTEEPASFSAIQTIQANNATGQWTDTNHDSGFYRVKYKDSKGRMYYQSPIFTYNEDGGLSENRVYNLEVDGIQDNSGNVLVSNNLTSFIFDLFPFYANFEEVRNDLVRYNIDFESDMALAKHIFELSKELNEFVNKDQLPKEVARFAKCFIENTIIADELIAEHSMTSRGGGFTLGDLEVDSADAEDIAPAINDHFQQAESCRDKIGEKLHRRIPTDLDWAVKSLYDNRPPSMTDHQTTWRTWNPIRNYRGVIVSKSEPNRDWT